MDCVNFQINAKLIYYRLFKNLVFYFYYRILLIDTTVEILLRTRNKLDRAELFVFWKSCYK